MTTALTRPTAPSDAASILALRQQLHDQHVEMLAVMEAIRDESVRLRTDYMDDIYAWLEEQILLSDIAVRINDDLVPDLKSAVLALNDILAGLPTAGGGGGSVDLTTIESRLQSLLDAIGTGGSSVRDILNWLFFNWNEVGGPYGTTAQITNVYRALTRGGVSLGLGDNYTYKRVEQIRDLLMGEGSGVDLSTVESRLQSIRDALPSDPATEGTLAAIKTDLGTHTASVITTLNSLDFCCEQGGDLTPPEPGTDPPPSDHCARAQWVIDGAIALMQTLAMLTQVGRKTVENAYSTIFGVIPSYIHCQDVSHQANKAIQRAVPENAFTDVISTMQLFKDELVCAIYNAADAGAADTAYQFEIEVMPAEYSAALVCARIALPLDILNPLFAGTLPDSAALTDYDSSYCDACGGSGATYPCPPSAGEAALDVTSNYRFLTDAADNKYTRGIEWGPSCRASGPMGYSCGSEVYAIHNELITNEKLWLVGNFNGYTFEQMSPDPNTVAYVRLIVDWAGPAGDYCTILNTPKTLTDDTTALLMYLKKDSDPDQMDQDFTVRITPPGAA
jgi:hypothetical protein